MATIDEMRQVATQIENETTVGGNTAERVGGLFNDIVDEFEENDAKNGYYEATISGGTITVNAPNYELSVSGNLRIKMPAAGTTATTLTIGNATNIPIWYNGAAVSSDNTWKAGEIISVFYDGTRFMASNSQGSDINDIFGNTNDCDFAVSDKNGNDIVRFGNGHIQTKNFDSTIVPRVDSTIPDFAISDENGWDIVQFSQGHIKTKNFDSSQLVNTVQKFVGKKFAIIGDSISTFQGWLPSDISGYDGTSYVTYYPSGNVNNPSKTWWFQMMQLLGLSVGGDTINVCAWSGSYVTGDSTSITNAAAGCSTRRITDLAIRGWNPDIVIIFISCNDFAYDRPLGTWDVNSAIVDEGNITEMRAAYALMINKIHVAYPNARVFCCTNLDDYKRDKTAGYPSNNNNGVTTYTWNQSIKQIADAMACDVIDMHACGLNYSNFQQFAVDAGTHPNAAGMSMMAQKAASELIAKY